MTFLNGYVKATYDQMVNAFGAPTYSTPSADEKVSTEWELTSYDEEGFPIRYTLYDWKDYDNGATSRSGIDYDWHIGGDGQYVILEIVEAKLKSANPDWDGITRKHR